jgi:hypothetical protein
MLLLAVYFSKVETVTCEAWRNLCHFWGAFTHQFSKAFTQVQPSVLTFRLKPIVENPHFYHDEFRTCCAIPPPTSVSIVEGG